jgi:hypothetical protein
VLDGVDLTGVSSRLEVWTRVIDQRAVATVAEVGVFQGRFAEAVLRACPAITTYYLIDPWRHLDDWNKPTNADDPQFTRHLSEALERTAPWESKRVVLRGRTSEVIGEIPDQSLDLAYIDGDHTLRGIAVDLIRTWPKIRPGGLLGGDDFSASVWQHSRAFEPTLVYPFAVYFAEAVGAPITALPDEQFVIEKTASGYCFHDPTGEYGDPTVRAALARHGPGWQRRHFPTWRGLKYRVDKARRARRRGRGSVGGDRG